MAANVFPDSPLGKVSPQLPEALHEAIRHRAEEIYQKSGRVPGHDVENWTQAEQEIKSEIEHPSGRRTAVVVKVDGVDYVGEYAFISADGYEPGEFLAGDAVVVRFENDKMYLKRANGKELETRIVRTDN